LRNGTADLHALGQVFGEPHAELPAPALDALRALGRPLTVLDLGANIGAWGAALLARLPVACMVALEPDPGTAAVLRGTVRANGREADWTVLQACAAPADGTVAFRPDGFGLSRMGDGPGSVDVPARDVFGLLDGVDLLKVDIEGAEWALVADARFAGLRCPVVSFEYHPHGRPGRDGRALARAALERAGYEVLPAPAGGESRDVGVLWGVRPPVTRPVSPAAGRTTSTANPAAP
jgi:FkbM family methyltransferase